MLEWKKMLKVWRKCLLFSLGAFFLPSRAGFCSPSSILSVFKGFWAYQLTKARSGSMKVSGCALSARRDNVLAGWASCALSALLFGSTFSRVLFLLSGQTSSLSGWVSLSQSGSLSEPFSNISTSSLF